MLCSQSAKESRANTKARLYGGAGAREERIMLSSGQPAVWAENCA